MMTMATAIMAIHTLDALAGKKEDKHCELEHMITCGDFIKTISCFCAQVIDYYLYLKKLRPSCNHFQN